MKEFRNRVGKNMKVTVSVMRDLGRMGVRAVELTQEAHDDLLADVEACRNPNSRYTTEQIHPGGRISQMGGVRISLERKL
jgi:hypothetical protein